MVHILRDIAGRNFGCELASSGYGGCESATPLAKDDLKAEIWPPLGGERGTGRDGVSTAKTGLFRGLTFYHLFVAKALDWVESRRSNCWHHSTQDSDDAENACRHGQAADINVQMNVSCLQVIAQGAHQRQCSHHPGDQVGDSDSRHSSSKGNCHG